MSSHPPHVIILIGPTASGKTELAIEIAEMKFANIEEKEEKLDALVFLKNQILRKADKLEIK